MDHGHKHSPVYFVRLLLGSVRLTDISALRRREVLGLQKLDSTYHSLCDLWALLMQYPGGQVPMSKCCLRTLCQPLGKTWAGTSNPSLGPKKSSSVLSRLSQQQGSQAPAPCSGGKEGPCFIYFLNLLASSALGQKKKKNYCSLQKSPCRGFLEPLAGPALKEREPHKESRIKSLNAVLMPSCLSSDLDMIKLMETQYPLNSWPGACTPELTQMV